MKRLWAALLAATFAAVLAPQPVLAEDPSLTQAQSDAALIEQVRLQLGSSLADALSAQQQLERSLKENAAQQATTQGKIDESQGKIVQLDGDVQRLDGQITTTQTRINNERAQLRSLARAMYAQPSSVALMLAQSRDFTDLLTRISDLRTAGNRASSLKEQLAEDMGRLDAARLQQDAARQEQVKRRAELEAALAKLKDLQRQQEESSRKLDQKIAETKRELELIQSQQAALAKQIADMIAEQQNAIIAAAMQAVWDQYQLWIKDNPVGATPPGPEHSKRYQMIWPMPRSLISQPFGPSSLALEPNHFHTGIDITAPFGTDVLAADDGVVAQVGNGPTGYGTFVLVAHANGLATMYAHMSAALVKPGDKVTQGQVVGKEGSTGTSTGPHVHFEVRVNGRAVDPAPFLPPGPPSDFRG
jgi:murein DD-endopeptidase MepM/ murein hydrolase activator NlpD